MGTAIIIGGSRIKCRESTRGKKDHFPSICRHTEERREQRRPLTVRCLGLLRCGQNLGRSLHFLPIFDGLAMIPNIRNVSDVIALELRFGSDHTIPGAV